MNLQYSFYQDTSVNGGFGAPQRPTHLPQFYGTLSLRHKSGLTLPITLNLNPLIQVQGAINTPMEGPKSVNILEYLSHPTNRIYINPTYKKTKLHAGHFVNVYSNLTAGDIKVFGLGVDHTQGQNLYRFQHGIIQPRVQNVLFNFNNGNYRRTLTAAKFSRNHSKKLQYGASIALARDQENSLEEAPVFRTPQKSAVLSLESKYSFNKTSFAQIEIANSAWSPNSTLGDSSRPFALPQFLIPGTSTLSGTAFSVNGRHKIKEVTVDGLIRYKTKDYRTLAYPYMQSDLFEMEFSPRFVAFKKKLQTRATFGYKTSNVSKQAGSSLRISYLKLSSVYKLNKKIQTSIVYAFNAVGSSPDSIRPSVKTSNHVIRLTPTYHFKKWGFNNTAGIILGGNRYINSSDAFATPITMSTRNLGLLFRSTYKKHSAGVSLNSLNTRVNGNGQLSYKSLMINAQTKLLKDQLVPFIRVSLTNSRNIALSVKTGSKRVLQVGSRYNISKKMNATIGLSFQNHKQGTGSNAPGYREFLGQLGLNYRL